MLNSISNSVRNSLQFIIPYITGYTIILFLSIILYFVWLRKSYLLQQNNKSTSEKFSNKTSKTPKTPKKVSFANIAKNADEDDENMSENNRNHSKKKGKGRSSNIVESFAITISADDIIFQGFKTANIAPELINKFNNLFTEKLAILTSYISNIKVASGIPADVNNNINDRTDNNKYLNAFNVKLNIEFSGLIDLLKKDIRYKNVKISDMDIKNKLIELSKSNKKRACH